MQLDTIGGDERQIVGELRSEHHTMSLSSFIDNAITSRVTSFKSIDSVVSSFPVKSAHNRTITPQCVTPATSVLEQGSEFTTA